MPDKLRFTPFPYMETDRLTLRKLAKSDIHEIYLLRSDDLVNRFIGRPKNIGIAESGDFIDLIMHGIEEDKWIYWVITLIDNPKLIGTICLWNFSEDNTITEIGYELMPKYQRKGFMQEAIISVVEYAFEILKVKRIEAFTHKQNNASCELLERNNFKLDRNKKDIANFDHVIYFLMNNRTN